MNNNYPHPPRFPPGGNNNYNNYQNYNYQNHQQYYPQQDYYQRPSWTPPFTHNHRNRNHPNSFNPYGRNHPGPSSHNSNPQPPFNPNPPLFNNIMPLKQFSTGFHNFGNVNDDGGAGGEFVHPWKLRDKYSSYIVGLHEEIEDFFEYISPTPQEHKLRMDLVQKITNCIHNLWPHAIVEVFGSFSTGLYLPNSDIDMVVIGKWSKKPLKTLEKALIDNYIAQPLSTKVLTKATVPIIKFADLFSNIKVDISFNAENGVRTAEYIKTLLKEYPYLGKLLLVLKQFLYIRNINEVFCGGLSSYALTMMIVSFIQMHPRLLNEKNVKNNLGVLLIEFFELYGRHFNYNDVGIRIDKGGSYVSKEEIQKNIDSKDLKNSVLCIEDPLVKGNDIGRSSYKYDQVILAFEYAYAMLTSSLNYSATCFTDPYHFSLLSKIIRIEEPVLIYRKWVKQCLPQPPQTY